jgi:hypothetical protein
MSQDAIRILSGVAEMALRIGALIRGGYSYGRLYHENNVVFGEAMVDAYRPERDVAVYPRAVVSDRILQWRANRRLSSNAVGSARISLLLKPRSQEAAAGRAKSGNGSGFNSKMRRRRYPLRHYFRRDLGTGLVECRWRFNTAA